MHSYTVHQAKTKLSKLIRQTLRGEEVLITKHRKPVVRLSACTAKKRRLGFLGKKVWMSKDFDKPLRDFKAYR